MFKRIIISILVFEAKCAIKRWPSRIIGITGSVGKSSTKEAISMVLQKKFKVRSSKKSYNSELGLALAILGLETAWHDLSRWIKNIYLGFMEIFSKNPPEILLLEMGIDRPQDMDTLISIVRPNIAVITAIGEIPVHIEYFSGSEEIAREKSKILKYLSAQGYAILNADDDVVWDMKDKTNARILSYGFGKDAHMIASNYKISLEGISFKVDFDGASVPVRLFGVFGKHHVYPALSALLVGTIFDMNLIDSAGALQQYKSPPGRMQLLEGIKGSLVLDDSYNASPLATHAALDTLLELEAKRKIVVFGDMLEIGKYTIEAHKTVGERVAKIADFFITVGQRSKFAAEEAITQGMDKKNVLNFSTSNEAIETVKELIKEGNLILVKGSQGMRMELIVEEIMAHPEQAFKLLCRQDEYWKNKK
ncbi:MAG: UDP-N-acetylmuramoyl-tripeptide--D-alanyl-D-alanine ligase [Patescibacteria group bacterium]